MALLIPLISGCDSLDRHGREDYLNLYVLREGTLVDHEKDRMLELCRIRFENGKVRLDAENLEGRWEVQVEADTAAGDLSSLAGATLDAKIVVRFKYEEYIKPVYGKLKIFEVRGSFVKGAIEGKGHDREVSADFQAR